MQNVESFGTNAVWYLTRRRRQVSSKILHRSPADDGYRYVLVLNIEPCNKVRNAFVLEGSCFLIPGL